MHRQIACAGKLAIKQCCHLKVVVTNPVAVRKWLL